VEEMEEQILELEDRSSEIAHLYRKKKRKNEANTRDLWDKISQKIFITGISEAKK
jgi:hypothetical protein